jgi:succinate dehydrogenase / fumarate reductase, cytochrome b subunit
MKSLIQSVLAFYQSSIGKKFIVAVTGVALLLFLAGHLLGNLLIFRGPEAINSYAKWLHSLGGLLWVARIGLLVCVVLHVVATIQLVRANRAARPVEYGCQKTRRASKASRSMIWSGSIVLAFVIYHLMHFTLGVRNGFHDPTNARYFTDGVHNVYNMVVDGFNWVPAALFYIFAMALLCLHLSHGFSSAFQTLGLTTPRTRTAIDLGGKAYAVALFLGNISIPISVLMGIVK